MSRTNVGACFLMGVILLLLRFSAFSQDSQNLNAQSRSSTDEAYEVVKVTGKARIVRHGEQLNGSAVKTILPGDTITTFSESSLLAKGENQSYLIHAHTTVKVGREFALVSGKLSRTASDNFVDLHFTFSPNPGQGKTMRVQVWSRDRNIPIDSHISNERGYKKKLTYYPLKEGTYRALSGFDVAAPATKYRLVIKAGDKSNYTRIVYPFWLRAVQYGKGKVFLTEGKSELLAPSEQKKKEQDILSEVLARSTSLSFWRGQFSYPVQNPVILSQFGKKRVYYIENRKAFIRYHRGVDFKGEKGEPVFAPNRGVVVFADKRITTGNTVVISHGQAVFSLFFHMDKIDKSKGEEVEKGGKIGEIGSTGITEGAHLHWGMLVDGVYVDPTDWVKRAF